MTTKEPTLLPTGGNASDPADDANDTLQPSWPPGVTQSHLMPEEQGIVEIMRHWQIYGEELRRAAGSGIYLDGAFATLRQGWRQIGEGLRLLLHPELCGLDAKALEGAICELLALPMEREKEVQEWNFFDDREPPSEPFYDDFCYTRAEALADGVLVDVTDTAKEAGFRIPVALTRALRADIYAIPERLRGIADTAGRLWDVLFMGHCAIKQQPSTTSLCLYRLEMPVREIENHGPLYEVKAVCGPGDDGEPVLTLMRPEED